MKLTNNVKFVLAAALMVSAIGLLANSLYIIKNDTSVEDFQATLQQQFMDEVLNSGYDQMVIQNAVTTEYNFNESFRGMALMLRPNGTEGMHMIDMSKAEFRVVVEQGDNGACTRIEINTRSGDLITDCILGAVQHK